MKNAMICLMLCVLLSTTYATAVEIEKVADKPVAVEVGAVVEFSQNLKLRQYTLKTDKNIELKVVFYKPNVFRISAAPNGEFKDPKNNPDKAQIVINDTPCTATVTVKETNKQIEFITKSLILRLQKNNCQFELLNSKNKTLWKEIKPLTLGKETTQTLNTSIDEFYYGGGQQNGYFSHKGTKIAIRADGNWNEGGHPNPAPFYMSNKGYGVLRNTFATGSYDFTNNQSIKLVHKENRLDAYYFVGSSFNKIIDLYTQFTGRPNFVPIWALELGEADAFMTRDKKTKEPLKDKDGNFVEITPDCIDRVAEQYRKHDMPGGWLLVNDGYGCGYVQLPFVVKSLKELGFYTGLWTEKGLAKTKWEVGTAGTRLQKLDVAWTGPAYQHSLDANKQAWESLVSNSQSRGFVWTVQGWAGTQRYSICWTGDQYGSWDLIRYHIPTLIGSGMSGQAYATTDVDGIFGGSPETYMRDLQWKCFTPVLYAMNGWSHMNKSPWSYDEPYRSINRQYLKLKMRLTPYMYKYTKEAYDTGAPIVRGMIWDYPNDKKTWSKETQYQYLLGEWILVAPVYTSMKVNKGWRKEDIYLPEGQWIDYWDGRRIEGPVTIDAYPITLDKLPLLIKAGAIIPMYPEMLYNNQKPKDPLTFDIYPYGNSQFELYEDDGITRKHQQGQFAKQMISVTAPENKAGDIHITVGKSVGQFKGKLATRVYQFQVHSQLKPFAIDFDGQKMKELTKPRAFNGARSGWYYDKKDRQGIVHIKLPRLSTSKEVRLLLDIDETQQISASKPYPIPEITPDLDKTEFVVTCNSSQGGHGIQNAFDGTPETHWHSKWGKEGGKHPYTVDIELKGLYAINGLQYLPRKIGNNGMIKNFEIYISRINGQFDKPVYKGHFTKSKELQNVKFAATWGEYVRIKILSEVNGNVFGAAAEFDLTQDLNAPALPDKIIYLSDIKPASTKGSYKNNLSHGGKTITVNGQTYKKGIGVEAPSQLVYKLDGSWDKLSGHVGMDDEVGDKGSVMFRVFADGKMVFESPSMTGKNIKQLMELKIKGVKELRFVLLDQGDGNTNDHGDWIDVKLIRKGSK